jgi:hypothetical protein
MLYFNGPNSNHLWPRWDKADTLKVKNYKLWWTLSDFGGVDNIGVYSDLMFARHIVYLLEHLLLLCFSDTFPQATSDLDPLTSTSWVLGIIGMLQDTLF